MFTLLVEIRVSFWYMDCWFLQQTRKLRFAYVVHCNERVILQGCLPQWGGLHSYSSPQQAGCHLFAVPNWCHYHLFHIHYIDLVHLTASNRWKVFYRLQLYFTLVFVRLQMSVYSTPLCSWYVFASHFRLISINGSVYLLIPRFRIKQLQIHSKYINIIDRVPDTDTTSKAALTYYLAL